MTLAESFAFLQAEGQAVVLLPDFESVFIGLHERLRCALVGGRVLSQPRIREPGARERSEEDEEAALHGSVRLVRQSGGSPAVA